VRLKRHHVRTTEIYPRNWTNMPPVCIYGYHTRGVEASTNVE